MKRFDSLREADRYIDQHGLEAEVINTALGTNISPEDAKTLWWHFLPEDKCKQLVDEWQDAMNRKERSA